MKVRRPPTRAQRGDLRVGVLADLLLVVRLAAGLVELLRLRGAALQQPDRPEDEQRELQVLRLPVLHHGLTEVRRGQIAAERDRVGLLVRELRVGDRVVVELVVAGDRLKCERDEKQHPEPDRQAVVLEEAHGSVVCEADHREVGDPGHDHDEIRDEHGPHGSRC